MVNTPMIHLVMLLMLVFSVSGLVWAAYTFIRIPGMYRKVLTAVQQGQAPTVAVQGLQPPAWLSKVMLVSQSTLAAAVVLVFFLHLDVDFTLFLILATLASGVIWVLDAYLIQPLLSQCRMACAEAGLELENPAISEYGRPFFPVLALVLVVRSFVAEPFTIPSGSMLPTLQVGDYILVSKYSYGLRNPLNGQLWISNHSPKRGDIMVFRYPDNPKVDFIKRVVGLPGDHLLFDEGRLSINGQVLPMRLLLQRPDVDPWEQYYDENLTGLHHIIRVEVGRFTAGHHWSVTVPLHHYFMMGDNRDNSRDSRFWGFLDDHYIVGKAELIWMHKDEGWHLPTVNRDAMLNKKQLLDRNDVYIAPDS